MLRRFRQLQFRDIDMFNLGNQAAMVSCIGVIYRVFRIDLNHFLVADMLGAAGQKFLIGFGILVHLIADMGDAWTLDIHVWSRQRRFRRIGKFHEPDLRIDASHHPGLCRHPGPAGQ